MHILESYALQNDLKIDRAAAYEKFFPLAVGNYITIDTSGLKTPAMKYDHWPLVIELIKPKLDELDISIVQLGDKDCTPLKDCYLAVGQCNFNQKAYVIKKSLLHVSSNNETSHLASHYNRKSIVLFPYNCHIGQFEPYWSESSDLKLLQGTSDDPKPSFNPAENPKSINTITPEEIASNILNFLGVHTFAPELKTLKVGNSYYRPRIESNLSHILDVQKLGVSSLIMRMDLNFNEQVLMRQLESCPCSIITNKPINDFILKNFSKKIVELVYYLGDDHDPSFVEKLKSHSITYLLRTRKTGEELDDLKLDYLDLGAIQPIEEKTKEDLKELKNKNKIFYKSKHIIIHNNKFYPSTAALLRLKQGSTTMDFEPQEVIDDPLFWEEEEHFHFLAKN